LNHPSFASYLVGIEPHQPVDMATLEVNSCKCWATPTPGGRLRPREALHLGLLLKWKLQMPIQTSRWVEC